METPNSKIRPLLAFSKDLDLVKDDREVLEGFLNFVAFQVSCEQEINKQNFEAQTAITSRAVINLN